jgi:hypothetical protein
VTGETTNPAAAMLAALQGMAGREVLIRLATGGEIAGVVRGADAGLAYLDTNIQQARPSPLAQDKVVMTQVPADVVIDVASVAAVLAVKQ